MLDYNLMLDIIQCGLSSCNAFAIEDISCNSLKTSLAIYYILIHSHNVKTHLDVRPSFETILTQDCGKKVVAVLQKSLWLQIAKDDLKAMSLKCQK